MVTDAPTEVALDELLSDRAIRKVLVLYARGIDRLNFDLVRSCFHPDAVLRYGNEGTVDDFIAGAEQGLPQYSLTQHFIGNTVVDIDGDAAVVEAYCLARHRIPVENGPDKDFVWGGRYIDRFERRQGQWKIAHRTVVHDYTFFHPVTEKWPAAVNFTQGLHSPDDIVFQS